MKTNKHNKKTIIAVSIFFAFLGMAAWIENSTIQTADMDDFFEQIKTSAEKDILYNAFPLFGYAKSGMWQEDGLDSRVIVENAFPLYTYFFEEMQLNAEIEDADTLHILTAQESGEQKDTEENEEAEIYMPQFYEEMMNENHHAVVFIEEENFLTEGCGFVSEISEGWVTGFTKAQEKTVQYDMSRLTDYEFVMEHFYTVDACTSAGADLLNPQEMLSYDATVDKTQPGPHILFYHTHASEGFVDSVPGDKSTTIAGAGAKLAQLLREEYGYEVYHHTGIYDDTRDDAYAKAAPALEEILEQYPQIQVIIDLHRDGVAESRHLVADWEGKKVAQFMFFNGLSYLNTKGNIDYLPNSNLRGNLATSYQATIAASEYYPGLVRRTYLNGYRYNMHYREKTLLIELGAQTNTVDEIMSACEPLAHVLDTVFTGENM